MALLGRRVRVEGMGVGNISGFNKSKMFGPSR
jgi:hypothetical protein